LEIDRVHKPSITLPKPNPVSTSISKDSASIVQKALKGKKVIKFLKTQGDVKSISNPKVLTPK